MLVAIVAEARQEERQRLIFHHPTRNCVGRSSDKGVEISISADSQAQLSVDCCEGAAHDELRSASQGSGEQCSIGAMTTGDV
jgi:hypothetical protein